MADDVALNETAIDLATHAVRVCALGAPQSSRDAFALLVTAGLLDRALGDALQRMVGFRNTAVQHYQALVVGDPVVRLAFVVTRGARQPATTTATRVRGPCTPTTRSSSMSLVADGPVTMVMGTPERAASATPATPSGSTSTTWSSRTTQT